MMPSESTDRPAAAKNYYRVSIDTIEYIIYIYIN